VTILKALEQLLNVLKKSITRLRLVSPALVLYFLFITFPGVYASININLDQSWAYEINRLSAQFGWQDVVFTYGPLGYLISPLNIGPNLIIATTFQLFIHILLGIILLYYVWCARSTIQILLFVTTHTLATFFFLLYEYHLLIVFGLLLSLAVQNKRIWFITAPISGVLAATFFFIKTNLGLCSLGMLLVCGLALLHSSFFENNSAKNYLTFTSLHFTLNTLKQIRLSWLFKRYCQEVYFILAAGMAYLLMVIVIFFVYLAPFENLVRWVNNSLEIANNYSIVHSLVGSTDALYLGLLILGVYLVQMLLLQQRHSDLKYISPIFIVLVFFAFKGGFVRQEPFHEISFFPTMIAINGIFLLITDNEKILKINMICLPLLVSLTLPAASSSNLLSYSATPDLIFGQRGWAQINNLIYFRDVQRSLDDQSRKNLDNLRLPDDWLNLIRPQDNTVGAIPITLTYCPANHLTCIPNPFLQFYVVNSQRLDNLNADHYREDRGPEFLILEFVDIDGRNPFLSLPATWRAILQNYAAVRFASSRGLILLQKQPFPVVEQPLKSVEQTESRRNEWMPVPTTDHLLFVSLDMNLNWLGHLSKFLFRVPPVNIDLMNKYGEVRSYRITPDTAKDGLLISMLPSDITTLEAMLKGVAYDDITTMRFKISGPGTNFYQSPFDITWHRLGVPLRNSQATPVVYGQPSFFTQTPAEELESSPELTQTFLNRCPRLSRFDLFFADKVVNDASLTVRLIDAATDQLIYENTISALEVQDNAWRQFVFEPLPNSMDKTYRLSLHSLGSSSQGITVWGSKTDVYPFGEVFANGVATKGDLAFRYGCAELSPGSTSLHLASVFPPSISRAIFTINSQSQEVVTATPPSEITWPLIFPSNNTIKLRTGLAMNPAMWDQQPLSDGVTFNIFVDTTDNRSELLLTRSVDPNHHQADRAWLPIEVDLSEYAGKVIVLRLETTAGPIEDYNYDWAGWVVPEVTVSP
jgi:hypothetical protein